jgi:hopanoid biosynthesis associated protein HpnK
MPPFLIITADDFGLHEAVNEAVEQATRAGVLTAASLMVGAAASADAIRRARELPQLRVGLHLVLADGIAVLAHDELPSITDPRGYMDERMFVNGVRFFALPGVRRQLEAEIHAQFKAFARTGLKLDHVNVHKHFHLHPTLLGLILRIGADYGLDAMRVPDEPLWFGGVAAGLLKPLLLLMKRRLDAAQVFHNDTLFGIAATGAMDEATLLGIVARLPPGVTEIYLHPATRRDHALTSTMQRYRHADELAALLSAQVGAAITPGRIARGGYGDARRALACSAAAVN